MRPNLRSIRLGREDLPRGYPFNVPAIASLRELALRSRVCFFVGENGSGKSTLLEAVGAAAGFGREGGGANIRYRTRQDEAPQALAGALTLTWDLKTARGYFLRAESLFNIATYLDVMRAESNGRGGDPLQAYGGKSLHEMSHGESFLALFQHRFGGDGLYLFDEPEAAVSPLRQMSLLVLMHDLLAKAPQAQFIIATHSPILLSYPDAQIYSFDGGQIAEIGYRDTQAFRVTNTFLRDPGAQLRRLFSEDAEP